MKNDYTSDDMAAFGFVPYHGITKFVRDELARNERRVKNDYENRTANYTQQRNRHHEHD